MPSRRRFPADQAERRAASGSDLGQVPHSIILQPNDMQKVWLIKDRQSSPVITGLVPVIPMA
jgi:hypothetical protein